MMKSLILSKLGYFDVTSSWKSLDPDHNHGNALKLVAVEKAQTLNDLYNAIGESAFVIVPMRSADSVALSKRARDTVLAPTYDLSTISESGELEGTRLTLLATKAPSGFEFTIRTPGTPMRWTAYCDLLHIAFTRMCDILKQITISEEGAESKAGSFLQEELLESALCLFYYWVTFAPLSRGTAACGYAALLAVITAGNYEVSTWLPAGKQLDWEAILSPTLEDFLCIAKQLISIKKASVQVTVGAQSGSPLLDGAHVRTAAEPNNPEEILLSTLRGRLFILNCASQGQPTASERSYNHEQSSTHAAELEENEDETADLIYI